MISRKDCTFCYEANFYNIVMLWKMNTLMAPIAFIIIFRKKKNIYTVNLKLLRNRPKNNVALLDFTKEYCYCHSQMKTALP